MYKSHIYWCAQFLFKTYCIDFYTGVEKFQGMQDNILTWFVTFHFKVKCQIIWFTGASMFMFYLVTSDLTQQNKRCTAGNDLDSVQWEQFS